MNDRIPNLSIERNDDGSFLLEQDHGGNTAFVELHPSQARHLAVMAGLIPADGSAYTPPASVLARRMRVLLARINELDDRLQIVSLAGREDLEHEITFSAASWELATELCADLGDAGARPDSSRGNVTGSHAAVTPPTVTAAASTHPVSAGSTQLALEP